MKYWKPEGVTCTSDPGDPSNIISMGKFHLIPQRLFTVGRLDKDSTGLILLTSDGRVNEAMLNRRCKKEKIYEVEMDRVPSAEEIAQLASGVVITTPIQRDGSSTASGGKSITAKTLPCYVKRVGGGENLTKRLEFTLIEGRNRQIRRMAEAVGLQVVKLHRTSFAGIRLKGLAAGNWQELSGDEMKIIQEALTLANRD